ncbi:MAG TPA: ParB/RepB/Spo0J family partition protein [Chloroflexota bacterium]|nr:ParB/RepB/Spo0J family partition protein [Chloroflexota bacterium]
MPSRKSGLGRGLGALIPQSSGGAGLLEVDVDRIMPNPWQPRLEMDASSLAELVQSIKEHGILQPLIVTRAENDSYALVAGERRWRAAKGAGLLTVPVVVKETTPRQRLELALVENIQREDLSPLETAQAYRQLIDEHNLTQEAVSERVGKSRAAVANALRLLQLPPAARDALARGLISEGHGRALLSCASPEIGAILLEAILQRGLSVRQAEELARRLNAAGPGVTTTRPAAQPLPPDAAAIEDRFRQALGTKVQLYKSRRGGRLVIHFYSDDELTGLYEAICGSE